MSRVTIEDLAATVAELCEDAHYKLRDGRMTKFTKKFAAFLSENFDLIEATTDDSVSLGTNDTEEEWSG